MAHLHRHGKHSFHSSRRGDSIIGPLILIASSVAMTSIILSWSQGFTGQSGSAFSQNLFRSNQQASEQINIDDVKFGATTVVYARNFGDVIIRIAAVYVHDAETGVLLNSGNTELATPSTVLTRSTKSITISFNSQSGCSGSCSGKMLNVRVASDHGASFEATFRVN